MPKLFVTDDGKRQALADMAYIMEVLEDVMNDPNTPTGLTFKAKSGIEALHRARITVEIDWYANSHAITRRVTGVSDQLPF